MNKIAIIGQSAFGESVAKEISKIRNVEISGIFTPYKLNDDPLFKYGAENKKNVFQFEKLRSSEAINEFNNLKVDLLVMAYVTDIVPMSIIKSPKKGTIQYHPSLLPKHRGPSSINWAIINGDKKTGISIFWPDEGLDTGPILLQKKVKISEEDSTGTLYFNKLYPLGVKAMIDSIKLVLNNNAPRISQNENNATYESWCSTKEINWNEAPKKIYNLIRGCDPQPGAWTKIDSKTVFLYNCKLEKQNIKDDIKKINIVGAEISIALGNNKIVIGRMKSEGGKKVNAAEWVIENKVTKNSKLG